MNEIKINNLKNANLGYTSRIIDGYKILYYNSNPNNCKLCTLDAVGNWLNDKDIDKVKEVLRLSHKLAFNVSLNHDTQIKFLEKHFKLISVAKIPIGYGAGFQHHCCFLTENKHYSGYNTYLARIEKEKPRTSIPINSIDEIFQNLKQITEEDLVKIKAYKQPKRAKDLIAKILEKK